jgi:hypothetical protein
VISLDVSDPDRPPFEGLRSVSDLISNGNIHILEEAVRPRNRVKLGSLLAQIGREAGGVDLDIDSMRGQTPVI